MINEITFDVFETRDMLGRSSNRIYYRGIHDLNAAYYLLEQLYSYDRALLLPTGYEVRESENIK